MQTTLVQTNVKPSLIPDETVTFNLRKLPVRQSASQPMNVLNRLAQSVKRLEGMKQKVVQKSKVHERPQGWFD